MSTGRPHYWDCGNSVSYTTEHTCPTCERQLNVVVQHTKDEDFRRRVSWWHKARMRCFRCRILAEMPVQRPAGHWDRVLHSERDREEAARKLFSLFCERWADKVRPKDEP